MKSRRKGILNSPPAPPRSNIDAKRIQTTWDFQYPRIFLEFRLQKGENPALWMNDYVNISFLSFPFHVKGGAKWQYGPTFMSQRWSHGPGAPPLRPPVPQTKLGGDAPGQSRVSPKNLSPAQPCRRRGIFETQLWQRQGNDSWKTFVLQNLLVFRTMVESPGVRGAFKTALGRYLPNCCWIFTLIPVGEKWSKMSH